MPSLTLLLKPAYDFTLLYIPKLMKSQSSHFLENVKLKVQQSHTRISHTLGSVTH